MGLARFLQVSDLHLGRPFVWLPPERRDERRRDQRQALADCVREAIERGVHAILVPGDLFDLEIVDADTLGFVLDVFRVPGCAPVFITPGNHDPYASTSLYWNARALQARGREWPSHVHVFTRADWTAVPLPAAGDVQIWGRAFTSTAASQERVLAPDALRDLPAPGGGRLEVGLFHGSREGQCPPGQDVTGPFSDEEVAGSPFHYLAAGHYHRPSRITAAEGAAAGVRLAYAGSAVALDPTEVGSHGALEVRIEYGHRLPYVEVEAIELDRRRVFDLSVDVTGCQSAERVDRRVEKALDDAGVRDKDVVTVRLEGRFARDVRYRPAPTLAARAFHLRVDARRARPDYDLEGYRLRDPATTEERFVRALLDRLDGEQDPEQRAVVERALYYGLDAFRLGEVVPAHEELGE